MTNPTSGAGRRNWLLHPVLPLLVPLLVALPACSGSSSGNKGSEDAGDQGSGLTYAPTFTAVYGEILSGTCATAFCHQGSLNNSLALDDQPTAYKALVNVEASGVYCNGLGKRVVPGDPAASLLVNKVDPPDGGIPLCGQLMPGQGRPPLDAKQVAQIKSWITMGAKND